MVDRGVPWICWCWSQSYWRWESQLLSSVRLSHPQTSMTLNVLFSVSKRWVEWKSSSGQLDFGFFWLKFWNDLAVCGIGITAMIRPIFCLSVFRKKWWHSLKSNLVLFTAFNGGHFILEENVHAASKCIQGVYSLMPTANVSLGSDQSLHVNFS